MRLSLESKYNIDKFSNYEMRYEEPAYYNKEESEKSSNFEEFDKPKSTSFDINNVVKVLKAKQSKIYGCGSEYFFNKNVKCACCNRIHRKIRQKSIYKKKNIISGRIRGNDNISNGSSISNINNNNKIHSCGVCPSTFKNAVQLRKHLVRCRKSVLPVTERKKCCLHSYCTQSFSNLASLVNHLKNEHIATKISTTYKFQGVDELESWRKKFASEFILLKTYKNKEKEVFRYYGCPSEFIDQNNDSNSVSNFCQGRLFITIRKTHVGLDYVPHDSSCEKNGSCHNPVTLNGDILPNDKLLLILSDQDKLKETESEKDVESIKKSIRDRIDQLNERIRFGDAQILLNVEYVLNELLKTFLKTEEEKRDNKILLGKELRVQLSPLPVQSQASEKTQTPTISATAVETFTQQLKDADDVNKVIFNVGPYAISSLHLKSLDYNIPAVECAILKSVAPDFRKGWLYDTIIDAFLYKLCKPCPNAMFLETAVSQIINNSSLNSLRMQLGDKYFTNIEHIFVAFNPNGKHWILLVVKPKRKQIEIYDPTSRKKSASQSLMKFVKQLICVLLNDFGSNETWGIVSPKHIIQKGNYNCGVYVCWYAERILNDQDVVSEFSGSDFRKYIYDFIRGCGI